MLGKNKKVGTLVKEVSTFFEYYPMSFISSVTCGLHVVGDISPFGGLSHYRGHR